MLKYLTAFAIALFPLAALACEPGQDKATYRQEINEASGGASFKEYVGETAEKMYDALQPHVAGMPKRQGKIEVDLYDIGGVAVGFQTYTDGCQSGAIILPAEKFFSVVGKDS